MSYVGNQPKYTNSPVYSGTGNGSTVDYTLTWTPGSVNALLVFLSGVQQRPTTDYTASGTTLTFTTAPPSGVPITVVGLAIAGTQATIQANSMTKAQFDAACSDGNFLYVGDILTTDFLIQAQGVI